MICHVSSLCLAWPIVIESIWRPAGSLKSGPSSDPIGNEGVFSGVCLKTGDNRTVI
jgi:hypothetical protein